MGILSMTTMTGEDDDDDDDDEYGKEDDEYGEEHELDDDGVCSFTSLCRLQIWAIF